MKRNIVFALILGFISLHISGQTQKKFEVYGIHIDTLADMVHKHPEYFIHLKNVWLKNPVKLSDDEMILLYYGSVFMPGYQPKKEDKAVEKIAGYMGEMNFEEAVKEGEQLQKIYPFSARLYMLLGYAYKRIGEKVKSKYYYKRYAQLLRVPLYSGQGKSFSKAFVVRNISDEYLILNHLDLELVQQEVRYFKQIPFDVMLIKTLSKDNKRMKILPKEKMYFNIYLPYFIGQGKNYKMLQNEAKQKYKLPD